MSLQRLAHIDVAKAIALIAVIVGHYGIQIYQEVGSRLSIATIICFSFHVALFFVVSGYFFRTDKKYSFASEARTLLLPYVASCILIILLSSLKFALFREAGAWKGEALTWTIAAFYGSAVWDVPMPADWIAPIGGLWFLLALFWGRLACYLVRKLPLSGIWVCVLFVVGLLSKHITWLPLSLQSGLCAALYIYVGQELRKRDLLVPGKIRPVVWIVMALVWIAAIVVGDITGAVIGLATNVYPHIWIDLPGEICGSICVIGICMAFCRILPKVGEKIAVFGRNTLPFYCAHVIELNIFPTAGAYGLLLGLGVPYELTVFLVHGLVIVLLALVFYALPRKISGIWFPSRRKPKPVKGSA